MPNYLFSTGKLSIAPVATVFDATHVIGAVQSADFEHKMEVKEVREATFVSHFPVDNVMFDAAASLKIEAGEFAEKLIEYATGAAKSSSGGNNVYTASTTATIPYVKIKLEGKTSDGRNVTLEIARARAVSGLPLGMKRDSHTMPTVDFRVYPALVTDIPWVLTIAQ